MLGDGGAHALNPGGEDVALWYLLKDRDWGVLLLLLLLLCRENRSILGAVVLGHRCRRWNLDHRTSSDLLLLCCPGRIWW